MKEYDELTDQGQVRRLRRCSRNVLRNYGIAEPQLTLLAHHRQTTFKVELQATGQRYVLRYHRPEYRDPAAVRSEFHWLRSLRKGTDVDVPEPVPTLAGSDVLCVAGEGLPRGLHCSMTKWVEGKRYFRKGGPGIRVMRLVGRISAKMHRHSQDFDPPEWFRCPTWDAETLFPESQLHVADAEGKMLDAEGRELLYETEERITWAMDELGTGSDVFGLIHGDLMQANYLIDGDEVRVIDFADFGWGHFLYDMAITLFALWGLDDAQVQRAAFLSGYREVRPFSPEHEKHLDLFIAARAVKQARFAMCSTHPADQRMAANYIRRVISGLKVWLH